MTDLRKAAEMALEVLLDPKTRADEVAEAVKVIRQALAQPEQEPWVKTYCGGKPNYTTPVDGVTISAERVHKTDKSIHEPLYMDMSQVPTGMPDWKPGMIFPAPKREWVGLTHEERDEIDQTCRSQMEALFAIEAKLKEKNDG